MCIAINYTPLSMGMAYYTYDSAANFLSLGPTVLICTCISKEQCCKDELRGVGNLGSYGDFSEGQHFSNVNFQILNFRFVLLVF